MGLLKENYFCVSKAARSMQWKQVYNSTRSTKANYVLSLLLKGKSQQGSSWDTSSASPASLLCETRDPLTCSRSPFPVFSVWMVWKVVLLSALFFFLFFFQAVKIEISRFLTQIEFSLLHPAPSPTLLTRSVSVSWQRPILEILFCSRICNLQHLHSDHSPFFPSTLLFFPRLP